MGTEYRLGGRLLHLERYPNPSNPSGGVLMEEMEAFPRRKWKMTSYLRLEGYNHTFHLLTKALSPTLNYHQ